MSALASSSSSGANGRSSVLPRDARLMALMLASKGVEDADERVLLQMLDFAHRYTTDLLLDAQTYSEHAGRPGKVETKDVELAVQSRSGWEWRESSGGPKDYLLPIAKQLNQIPLPPLRESYSHILLPPQHQQLGTVNFNLVPRGRSGAAQELEEEQEDDDEDGDSESEVNGDGQDGDHDEAAPSSEGEKRREDPGRQDGEAAADQDRNGTRADNDDDDNGKEDESMGTGADAEEAAADNSGRGNDDKKEDESTSTADRNGAVAPVSARSPPRPTIRQDEPEAAVAGHMS